MDNKTWIIDEVNAKWGHNKGALHATQYCPTSGKVQSTAQTNSTNFVCIATMYDQAYKGATILLKKYMDTCRCHMILHDMWDVFRVL